MRRFAAFSTVAVPKAFGVANPVAAVYDRRILYWSGDLRLLLVFGQQWPCVAAALTRRNAAEDSGLYNRTNSALFAGIQPFRLFGSVA